jgi:subtilisin-like proprotein convertase family protein
MGHPFWRRTLRHASAALLLLAATPALSAPTSIAYSGELRAENGVLYTGQVAVKASLFGVASGGSAIYGPQDLGNVMVSQGLFNVMIGGAGAPSLDPALMQSDNLWLELTVNDVPMAPRQRLHSVPFARVAQSAQSVGSIPANQVASKADLAAHPSTAMPSAMAPANPVAGQLWLDTDENKVYVWANGQWRAVSVAGLEPQDLPGDGLNDVSNNTLSNEFFDVLAPWTGGPTIIPDNNPAGINATVTVAEGGQAKLYGLQISTKIEVSVVSQIQIILQPPVSTGVNPIVLFDGTLSPQGGQPTDITMTWDPASKPELAALINKGPAGQWILNVSDDQFTVVQGVTIGRVKNFDILYDVLRSDEVLMQGDMTVNGQLNVSGPIHGKHIMWSGGCTNHGTGGGFVKYCTDGLDFNSAQGYLSVNPNGDFTVLKAGYYRINWFGICGQAVGWFHTQVVVNGSHRHYGHQRGYGNHQDMFIDLTWKMNVGDVFHVNSFNAGQFAYHAWSPGGAHSRLQVHFLGE